MRIKAYPLLLAAAVLISTPALAETVTPAATSAADTGEPATSAPAASAAADPALTTDGPVTEALMTEGEGLFKRNCRQCHGSKGTAGVPLKDNEKVGDAFYLTSVILTGPGYMTEFAEALDDNQIAAIASFVRNSWGNEYGAVTPEDVASMR